MSDIPRRVERDELDFDPDESWVWWCGDCEEYFGQDGGDGHYPSSDGHSNNVCHYRVVLGEELG